MVTPEPEERAATGERPAGSSGEPRRAAAAEYTLLLVEDMDEHRYMYATVLRVAGYTVLEASDGERALAVVRDQKPDLILLDLGLPVIDGWQVIQMLKTNPATREIPIIALTVHAFAWDENRALQLGCAMHMAKPVRPHEVLLAVHRVLGLLPDTATS